MRIDLIKFNGVYFKHDPRIHLKENTVENPAAEAMHTITGDKCPVAPKSFINAAGCRRQHACSPPKYGAAFFRLNGTTLRRFYTEESKYVAGLELLATLHARYFIAKTLCMCVKMPPRLL